MRLAASSQQHLTAWEWDGAGLRRCGVTSSTFAAAKGKGKGKAMAKALWQINVILMSESQQPELICSGLLRLLAFKSVALSPPPILPLAHSIHPANPSAIANGCRALLAAFGFPSASPPSVVAFSFVHVSLALRFIWNCCDKPLSVSLSLYHSLSEWYGICGNWVYLIADHCGKYDTIMNLFWMDQS